MRTLHDSPPVPLPDDDRARQEEAALAAQDRAAILASPGGGLTTATCPTCSGSGRRPGWGDPQGRECGRCEGYGRITVPA